MNIKIPVQNTVEVVMGDIDICMSIRFREQYPARSLEAQVVVGQIKSQLDYLASKFAHEISRKVAEELENSIK